MGRSDLLLLSAVRLPITIYDFFDGLGISAGLDWSLGRDVLHDDLVVSRLLFAEYLALLCILLAGQYLIRRTHFRLALQLSGRRVQLWRSWLAMPQLEGLSLLGGPLVAVRNWGAGARDDDPLFVDSVGDRVVSHVLDGGLNHLFPGLLWRLDLRNNLSDIGGLSQDGLSVVIVGSVLIVVLAAPLLLLIGSGLRRLRQLLQIGINVSSERLGVEAAYLVLGLLLVVMRPVVLNLRGGLLLTALVVVRPGQL